MKTNELYTVTISIHGKPSVFCAGSCIDEAIAFYNESIATCTRNLEKYPNGPWEGYIKDYQHQRDNVFVWSFEKFLEESKKAWLTKPVEISEELYYEMLEVLPPLKWEHSGRDNWFLMSEFMTGTFTNQYARIGGKYYCAMVDAMDRTTWIINNL